MEDWWWIPGELHIADIMTKGSSAEELKENSTWQNGPDFLRLPVEAWPKKSAREVAVNTRENVNKRQRKAFTAVITRSQTKLKENQQPVLSLQASLKEEIPDITAEKQLLAGESRTLWFSGLSKLVSVTAWVCRAAKRWLEMKGKGRGRVKDKELL